MAIKRGDRIKVKYTGTLDDGSVFESTGKSSFTFKVGSGAVIRGLDDAVLGLNKGDVKNIVIPPEKAYGYRQEMLVQSVERDFLPDDSEPSIGDVLDFETESGDVISARVVNIDDCSVTLDMNHPLANKRLAFHIEVVDC